MPECSNENCLKPTKTRFNFKAMLCSACFNFRKVNGFDRVQKVCQGAGCLDVLNGNRKFSDYCNECNVKVKCSAIIDGVQCDSLRYKYGSLCGGHKTQATKFGKDGLKAKDVGVRRGGLQFCPSHPDVLQESHLWKGRERYTCPMCVRQKRIEKKYGLSEMDFLSLLKWQDGACAFSNCMVVFREDYSDIHVDHDHQTGRVRGLLCRQHNLMLGFADDQIDYLMDGVNYLKNAPHGAWKEHNESV